MSDDTPTPQETLPAPVSIEQPEPPTRPHDREMPFREHLREMRTRILVSVGAWVVCSIGTWFCTPWLIAAMRRPLPPNINLVFTKPTEAFMVYLKTAVLAGLFLALPLILYQLAAFVSPGLEANEKKWIKRIVPAAFLLFIGGGFFGYFCVLPVTLGFFLSFATEGLQPMLTISEYIGMTSMMLIVCGLIFQTPIIICVLAAINIVNVQMLRKGRRIAILAIFIIAAIVTPTPDAFTQAVVALPMLVLYELSIWIVVAMKRGEKTES